MPFRQQANQYRHPPHCRGPVASKLCRQGCWASSEWGRTQDSPVDDLPHKRMNQHLPGTRSRPGTRCGRHSCPNSRQSPARVGLGTIDMGREARPGRYLRPALNRLDPIDQTPSQSLLTATFGSWWVPFVRRAAFVLATTSSVRESTLVSSSGLLEFSLPSRKLPGVDELDRLEPVQSQQPPRLGSNTPRRPAILHRVAVARLLFFRKARPACRE